MQARTPLSARTERRLAFMRSETAPHADTIEGHVPPLSPAEAQPTALQSPALLGANSKRALAQLSTGNLVGQGMRGGDTGGVDIQRQPGSLRAANSNMVDGQNTGRHVLAAAGRVSGQGASAAVPTARGEQTDSSAMIPPNQRQQSQIPRCPSAHPASGFAMFCLLDEQVLTSCVLRRLSLGSIAGGQGSGHGPGSNIASAPPAISAKTPRTAMSRLGPRAQRQAQPDQNTAPASGAAVAMTERGRARVSIADVHCGSATARQSHASAAARRSSAVASAAAGGANARRAQGEGGSGKSTGQRWA